MKVYIALYVSLTGTSANKIFYIYFLSSRGEYKELDTSYSNLKIDPGFPAVKLTRQSKPELIRVSLQLTRLLPELTSLPHFGHKIGQFTRRPADCKALAES